MITFRLFFYDNLVSAIYLENEVKTNWVTILFDNAFVMAVNASMTLNVILRISLNQLASV